MRNSYHNANEAYEALLNEVVIHGIDFDNTKALFNCGFYILDPQDNYISNKQRNWSLKYAEAECCMVKYRQYGNVWLMSMAM
jgi:hypothetical protein